MKRARYDDIVCNECCWTGRESDGHPGDITDLWYYIDCPKCYNESISAVKLPSYKTDDTTINNADMRTEYNDLPDIDGENIILTWEVIIDENDESNTCAVVRHDDSLVWKRSVSYGCFIDFIEFCIMAKKKYGNKLIDVRPSHNNHQYLYGDYIPSVGYITSIGKAFKKIKK